MITTVGDNLARVFISAARRKCAGPDPGSTYDFQQLLARSGQALRVRRYCGARCGSDRLDVRRRECAARRKRESRHEVQARRPTKRFLAPWTARMREALGDTEYIAAFESGYCPVA